MDRAFEALARALCDLHGCGERESFLQSMATPPWKMRMAYGGGRRTALPRQECGAGQPRPPPHAPSLHDKRVVRDERDLEQIVERQQWLER
jgi:hypothetical protein